MSDGRPMLRIGHSPDPDDAFMWWPLLAIDGAAPRLDTGRFRFRPEPEDIEALNRRAELGELEITAMSCAQYPHVKLLYAVTSCGSSMGEAYGPKLVAREPLSLDALARDERGIAVPGRRTSAFAALSLALGTNRFHYQVVSFDRIIDEVAAGRFAAGLVIHEGQLTYRQSGLQLIVDLGQWWFDRHQVPLPLGINAVRRDLEEAYGPGTLQQITRTLLESVRYAMAHREESIAYALGFARGLPEELADEFIRMYVNQWTLDFGEAGRTAVHRFLRSIHEAGLAPEPGDLDFVQPEPDASPGRGLLGSGGPR